jgi:hypothetical protein
MLHGGDQLLFEALFPVELFFWSNTKDGIVSQVEVKL